MKFQVVYDLKQYDSVLIPIEDELRRRGWGIVRGTAGSYNTESVSGSIGCQTGGWIDKNPLKSPSFLIFHGVSFIKQWARYYKNWDYVIVPSKFWETSLRSGNGLATPLGLGWSKADILLTNRDKKDVFSETLRKRHNLNGCPIVLFAPTYSKTNSNQYPGNAAQLRSVVKCLPNYNVIFMPHVMCDFKSSFNDYQPRVSHDDTKKHEYLLGADVLISDTSSLVFEFALLDKPVIMLDNPSIHNYLAIRGTSEVVDLGDIVPIDRLDLLGKVVDSNIEDPNKNGDRRRFWTDKCLGYCDGNSTKRIVDKLEEICG
jgi:CDP-glycerol glycerophosphotransferase (TagB/SpsB family)